MRRSRAARRWRRKGYTHEVTYLGNVGYDNLKVILVLRPQSAAYFRKHPTLSDEVVRPVGHYYIHNGRKPR